MKQIFLLHYIDVIELACLVHTGKILVKFIFLQVYGPCLRSINYYDSILNYLTAPHILSVITCAQRENVFLLHHSRRTSAKIFGQTTKKVST